MNSVIILLLLVTVFSIAWIEWIPERYRVFSRLLISFIVVSIGIRWLPEWYGWFILSAGIAELVWIFFSPKRRKEWPNLFSGPARALREKTNFLTAGRMRNAAGAICAVLLSPIAALPSVFVLSVLLVTWDVIFGNSPQIVGDWQEMARRVLGISYVAVVATADLFARYLLICGPLLLAGGYAITAYSVGSGAFCKRYSRGLLLFGTIYPIVFVAASVFDWFDRPFFN